MFNQEMQNAQESAEAETPAKLKRKYSSIFPSLHFCSPWTTDTPNQRTATTHATENCKNYRFPSSPDCARYRYYSSAEPLYESNHYLLFVSNGNTLLFHQNRDLDSAGRRLGHTQLLRYAFVCDREISMPSGARLY